MMVVLPKHLAAMLLLMVLLYQLLILLLYLFSYFLMMSHFSVVMMDLHLQFLMMVQLPIALFGMMQAETILVIHHLFLI